MDQVVQVGGEAVVIRIENERPPVWVARGVFRGRTVEARARSAARAAEYWVRIAAIMGGAR